MIGTILRLEESDKQTLGLFQIFDGINKIFECKVLELPDRDNQTGVSRIPEGYYKCEARFSPTYKQHFIIKDVHNRSFILIHNGNYYTQTRGCVLVGENFLDINKDGYNDVTNSVATLKKLNELELKEFDLKIINL